MCQYMQQIEGKAMALIFIFTLQQARSLGGGRGQCPPAKPVCPQLEEETVQWPCPLIDQSSGCLRKIELCMGCSVGFKYVKNEN